MSTKHYIAAARYDEAHGSHGAMPPAWVLDRQADLQFSGGFKLTKKNLCTKCYTYRAANGTCGCS